MEIKNSREKLIEKSKEIEIEFEIINKIIKTKILTPGSLGEYQIKVNLFYKKLDAYFLEIENHIKEVDKSELKFICEKCGHLTPISKAYKDPTDDAGVYEIYECEKCGFEDWVENCSVGKMNENLL
jgi:DNA-directed RNA polymerase subunit M/transcription elongation factor TFIIS